MRTLWAIALGLLVGVANAAVQTRDVNADGTVDAVYDPAHNLTWLADANYACTLNPDSGGGAPWLPCGGANYFGALSFADNLTVLGFDDWRVPTATIPYCAEDPNPSACWDAIMAAPSELNWVPWDSLHNVQEGVYWEAGLYTDPFDGRVKSRLTHSDELFPWFFILAVRTGDIAAVPEPETYALLLAGLALIGLKVRRR